MRPRDEGHCSRSNVNSSTAASHRGLFFVDQKKPGSYFDRRRTQAVAHLTSGSTKVDGEGNDRRKGCQVPATQGSFLERFGVIFPYKSVQGKAADRKSPEGRVAVKAILKSHHRASP
jgi:hypothetical protein